VILAVSCCASFFVADNSNEYVKDLGAEPWLVFHGRGRKVPYTCFEYLSKSCTMDIENTVRVLTRAYPDGMVL
jgi:hypothetical protein